ncbi:hypothetical protein CRENBAI_026693 [Crenichthys baileyi]|uniref:Uncharacterized protein n=1 Tax=Crenichthys baileyi TaxID=28760 RepID=A0AAV9R179_9TELE
MESIILLLEEVMCKDISLQSLFKFKSNAVKLRVRLSVGVFVVPGFNPRHRRSLFILPQQYDCCLLDLRWGCGAEDRLNNPGTGLRPLSRKLNTGRNSSRSRSPPHIFLHSRPR